MQAMKFKNILTLVLCALALACAGCVPKSPETLAKERRANIDAVVARAQTMMFEEKLAEAQDILKKAYETYGSDLKICETLAYAYSQDNQPALAAVYFEKASAESGADSVLMLNVRALGVKKEDELKEGAVASLGGGVFLLVIYLLLALIGMKAGAFSPDASTGADILSSAAAYISPSLGRYLIAVIFLIACFNTAVGLLSSCGEYFSSIVPSISRGKWIALFAVVSAVIANAGLDRIIALSSPVLELLYPAAITLILLAFLPNQEKLSMTYIIPIAAALLSSLLTMLSVPLPLSSYGFGWLLPAIVAGIIGFVLDQFSNS